MSTGIDEAAAALPDRWACVEIFGHRRHYGRISEVEQFGTKMLRVDVPTADAGVFETFTYGGAAIFGITPVTEESARAWAERDRPRPWQPSARLPPPTAFEHADQDETDGAEADDRPF